MKILENGWIFDSDFDSGNLARVDSVFYETKAETKQEQPLIALSAESRQSSLSLLSSDGSINRNGKYAFNIWTRPDGTGVTKPTKNRSWFHFSVERQGILESRTTLVFSIMNLNSVKKLFDMGLRPFFRKSDDETWRRIPLPPTVETSDAGMRINFQFTIATNSIFDLNDADCGSKVKPAPFGKYFFAYTIPYSYTKLQTRLDHLENYFGISTISRNNIHPVLLGSASKIPQLLKKESHGKKYRSDYKIMNRAGKISSIYFHRELLTQSLDGHRLDLLTISSSDGMVDNPSQEAMYPDLFPDGASTRSRAFHMAPPLNHQSSNETAPCFPGQKKYFVITARVHPAETVGSYILDGFLDFILCEHDPRAALLRSKFVFKVIPMLNPDGCSRGHYRDDSRGINLNRVYDFPHQKFHPTIYAVKKYIVDVCSKSGELGFYIDLHGHANKPGCFLFANRAAGMVSRSEVWNFGKRLKHHCPWFDLRECDFSAEGVESKTKEKEEIRIHTLEEDYIVSRGKAGTGRVAIYNSTNCIHCYTFESNYHSARHGFGWAAPVKNAQGYPYGTYCPPSVKCVDQTCVLGKSIHDFSQIPQCSVRGTGFTLGDLHSMGRSIALSALDVFSAKSGEKLTI